ncbi:hypothetical protein [Vibrio harveyi]|uniref:hypothetical protein n=1 Tax=Vibrio harveyi TaxID=669 RepID=UPI0018B0F12D|nr:hypothetical protein [Vibrio harveyi]
MTICLDQFLLSQRHTLDEYYVYLLQTAISQDKGIFERRSVISVIIISIGYFGFSQTSMD